MTPTLPLERLLPLRALVVTLECTDCARPDFFHQPALAAFLRYLAGSPTDFDQFIRFDACESGRVEYHAGDRYRFLLVALAGGDTILDTLLDGLSRLPGRAPKTGRGVPFRDNWRLLAVQDAFSEQTTRRLADTTAFTRETLDREATLWREHPLFHWQWLTPARLLRDKGQRAGAKGEARFCRDAGQLTAELLLQRLFDGFADLLRRRGAADLPPRGRAPEMEEERKHLFWLDADYSVPGDTSRSMGGIAGRLTLRPVPALHPAWWRMLVLGQYTGIGQRTAFGWGRYRLVSPDGGFTFRRPLPAASLLTAAGSDERLGAAWRHVMTGADRLSGLAAEEEWPEPEEEGGEEGELEALQAPLERLRGDIGRLLDGSYPVPELRGHLLPKKDGGVRPLAVPPVYDRVLQRVVGQTLAPALERLMYRGSHGYRPGRSRITASYDIQAAWRAGYRWVYESDVRDFFDSVDLQRLEERLRALYDQDPLVDRILAWMRAPVRFRGEHIERRNGLPQGSPLSPLMANLMLDDFDSDLEQAGFHLVRFADDFVILCKDPDEARAAGEAARASLREHGLDLNPDKTRITAMDDGFRYLGYLFVNDMVLDVSGAAAPRIAPGAPPPPGSWLAQLSEREPVRLNRSDALARVARQLGRGQAVELGEREDEGALMVVTGAPAVCSTLNRHLRVHRDDRLLHSAPWSGLRAVLLVGSHQITTQAMHAALRHGVPIHLAGAAGDYRGVIGNGRGNRGHQLWLEQLVAFRDPDKALYCAREVVAARLRHMKETLRQRHKAWDAALIDQAIRHIRRTADLDELRGLEGRATAEYYRRMAEILPDELGFAGRNRRPPRDPVNALLSLGYTVLYGHCESVLRIAGLFPWQGFYHQPRGDHAALASDLMEPFRHLVERAVLSLVLRREVGPDDFSSSPAGACRIASGARRKFLALLLQRFETPVRTLGGETARRIHDHLLRQALSLRGFIAEGTPFKAFRIR